MPSILGQKRGKLTIIKRVGTMSVPSQTFALYSCECECGTIVEKDSRHFCKVKTPMCDNCREDNRSRCFPKFSLQDQDLNLVKWRKHPAGYAVTGGGSNKEYAHRVVLERKIERKLVLGELTDHINRNKLDNRRSNLRVADKSLNAVNKKWRGNTTGFLGVYVYWPKEYRAKGWAKRYGFRIDRKGHETFYSRYYKTPLEASAAREAKLLEYIY